MPEKSSDDYKPRESDEQSAENAHLNPELNGQKLEDCAPEASVAYRAVKRAIDMIVSLLLLLCFAPIFLLIALAVKLTSKGSIFTRQIRVGQHGKQFVFCEI